MELSVHLTDVLKEAPKNIIIQDSLTKAYSVFLKHDKIICSVSGGSDSDLLVDICERLKAKVDYVWFDTGIEFQATKDHLEYLENQYGIEIMRYKAVKAIPTTCKEYGQPFISKRVSDNIYRLQKHGFKFEDRSFEELYEEYPNCKSALMWWCDKRGEGSVFGISRNKYLKEFMVENPPWFKVSNKCCEYAKKKTAHAAISNGDYDLNVVGIRGSEGAARRIAYKNCFSAGEKTDFYRPIFWYSDSDKKEYCEHYGIRNSACYSEYGLVRTGCVGCPYSLNLGFELEVLERYEPKLYKAAKWVFKDAYEYTEMYRRYRRNKETGGQIEVWDFLN